MKGHEQIAGRVEGGPDLRYLERLCGARAFDSHGAATSEIEALFSRIVELATVGSSARQSGDELTAMEHFRRALALASAALEINSFADGDSTRRRVVGVVVCLTLSCGDAGAARNHLANLQRRGEPAAEAEGWAELCDIESWPDAWLVAAIRRDPPDGASLEALAARYWRPLFGRCEILTLHREKAADLAQEAWRRVLRNRHALKPGGNFPAYLHMVATNIWRDWHRASRRAGNMAEDRLASLNAPISLDDETAFALGDAIPDLKSMDAEQQRWLMADIDHALGLLAPHLREVLVARFLNEESCADIGRRHGRTEQTVSAWVREAIRQMKRHLDDSRPRVSRGEEPI